MNGIQPSDIAERLYFRKRHWFHGEPKIKVLGNEGKFGKLQFDFGDEKVEFNVYLKSKDRLMATAQMAVRNFENLTNKMLEIYSK